MRVVSMRNVDKETFDSPLFTGPDVTRQTLLPDKFRQGGSQQVSFTRP
jgi:hypothetical protein